jgi:hypothetical protein
MTLQVTKFHVKSIRSLFRIRWERISQQLDFLL